MNSELKPNKVLYYLFNFRSRFLHSKKKKNSYYHSIKMLLKKTPFYSRIEMYEINIENIHQT